MHVAIFAERFIGRYGADRVCVILGELFRQAGHDVTLVGARFSASVLDRFRAFRVPTPSGLFTSSIERTTLRWLFEHKYFFDRYVPPIDLCIVGSFPFISAIPYLRCLAPQVAFLDFGVVPTLGYPRRLRWIIEGVRKARQRNLPQATQVIAISDFIARTQSRPDCGPKVPVSTVLLGADHLRTGLGGLDPCSMVDTDESAAAAALRQAWDKGLKLVLLLGRFEPGCYKNSQAAMTVMKRVLEVEPDAALLVMCDPAAFAVVPELYHRAFCLGCPSDAELLQIVEAIDAGISISLWEGFNLPVAELQHAGKPALALNLAAHPEVVVSKSQLCTGEFDMADKLADVLIQGNAAFEPQALAAWKERFSWNRFAGEFQTALQLAA